MATYTVSTGRKTFKDATGADTYNIAGDATRVTIAGKLVAGDVINIEGLASEYTVRASGRTVTLTNGEQTIVFQLSNTNGAASVRFLDGDLTATFNGKNAFLGTQKLAKKAVEVSDTALGTSDSSTAFSGTSSTMGGTFTLTTNVDGVSGTAGDDTISGLIGTSGTFTVGDDINGNAGTDTLNLIDASGTAGGFVSIDGVEVINVRTLVAAGVDTTELNAADWSGVASLTNASSIADASLNVSGLSTTTTITLVGRTDITADFSNTTTASVSVGILGTGVYDSTATTLASASAAATAHIHLNGNTDDLIDSVAVNLAGSSLARIEAGSAVKTYTITGSGNAVLVTDDTITSFDASAAQGNIDITLQGASEVVAKGGAGNDTFRLGTTFSNNDSIVGGAGTDTVTLTVGGFSRNLAAAGVEAATITFNDDAGGTVNATASSVATYTLAAGSAGADANVAEIASNAVVNLTTNADNLDDVSVDAASGATSLSINIGSGSGSVGLDAVSISDAAAVTMVAAANTTGTNTIASATFDSDTKSIAISTTDGDADLNITDLFVGGATALTITANGSAGMDLGTGISGSALAAVTIRANGSDAADISLDAIENSTGLTTITLDANSGADIFVSGTGLEFGNGASGGIRSVIVNLAAETNSLVGTAASAGSGIRVSTTGEINLTINIAADASGGVHVGTATLALGSATAETTSVLNISAGSIGTNAVVRLEKIDVDGQTGTQVNVGSVNVGASAQFVLASGGIDATNVDNADVSTLSLNIAASGWAEVGAITTTAGALNGVSVVAAEGASATFGAVVASGVGAVSVSVASGASANFGNIVASGSAAGSIAGTVGAITLGGSDAGGVTFGSIGASAVGAISVSGALDVTFGTITSNRVGTVDASNLGASGTFTIDLSGVSAAAEVKLGAGNSTVISGQGNDVITLKAGGSANDVIRFTSTAQGVDNIINFFAGTTGGDQIELATAMGSAIITGANGSAIANGSDADLSAVISGTGTTLAAADNVIVIATAFANTAAMQTFLSTGIALASAAIATATFVVAWTDGSDTYVSLVGATGAGSAGATTLASGGHTLSTTTLAVLQGVTPGALAAVNFDFV